jgi:C4-dicarboxylate transporter, DctM subunit
MSDVTIGLVGIAVLIIIFLLGMPVGFSMAIVGLAGFCYLTTPQAGLSILARDIFNTFSSYSFTVIPLFIFMGSIAFSSRMSERLYDAGHSLFGRTRGGLAMATVAACAGFAAICGSTSATAAAMGRVALPEMKRYGYDDSLATGTVAAGGGLGILIPPSTIFVVYGILTEQSIGKLFISGVIPGIILTLMFIAAIFIVSHLNPRLAPGGAATTWKEKIAGLTGVVEMLVIFLLVIGGLFAGWFSPTQAAAAGVAITILVSLVRRQLTWSGFIFAVKDALNISCMVMVIVAGAIVFGHFIAIAKLPIIASDWVSSLPVNRMVTMGIIIVIYIIGGCFMDALALITLTVPIIYPVVTMLGFDPLWFGVLIVLVTDIGVITPPVGVNVFVVKGVAPDIPIEKIFKGILPFFFSLILVSILLLIFPQIATFLPGFMTY